MKKISKHLLAEISLKISPLTENEEGQLRGGFAGLGGNDIDVVSNEECANVCVNNKCGPGQGANDDCENKKCINYCTNQECITTPTTTEDPGTGAKSIGLSFII